MHPLIPWFEPPVFKIPIGDWTLPLHGFGILVATGFVLGGKVAMGRAKALGLDPEVINRLIGWLVAGTFIGGHVGYGLMYKPAEYFANPLLFLQVWQGLSSFGGFVVCVPIAVWFFRSEKVAIWPYLDCLAYGLTIGWFFGRMGCFVAHDHPGTVTQFWLGVNGMCPGQGHDVACHDLGLYEALWSLAMFGVFTAIRKIPARPGTWVLALGVSYGPTRFFMDFFRPESTDVRYFGYTPGQYWAAVFTAAAVAFLVQRMRSTDPRIAPVEPPAAPKAPAAA